MGGVAVCATILVFLVITTEQKPMTPEHCQYKEGPWGPCDETTGMRTVHLTLSQGSEDCPTKSTRQETCASPTPPPRSDEMQIKRPRGHVRKRPGRNKQRHFKKPPYPRDVLDDDESIGAGRRTEGDSFGEEDDMGTDLHPQGKMAHGEKRNDRRRRSADVDGADVNAAAEGDVNSGTEGADADDGEKGVHDDVGDEYGEEEGSDDYKYDEDSDYYDEDEDDDYYDEDEMYDDYDDEEDDDEEDDDEEDDDEEDDDYDRDFRDDDYDDEEDDDDYKDEEEYDEYGDEDKLDDYDEDERDDNYGDEKEGDDYNDEKEGDEYSDEKEGDDYGEERGDESRDEKEDEISDGNVIAHHNDSDDTGDAGGGGADPYAGKEKSEKRGEYY